jgi:hypothetical protein
MQDDFIPSALHCLCLLSDFDVDCVIVSTIDLTAGNANCWKRSQGLSHNSLGIILLVIFLNLQKKLSMAANWRLTWMTMMDD